MTAAHPGKTSSRMMRVAVCLLLTGMAVAIPLRSAGAATPSGWNIVASPSSGTGANDVVLGSTCANASECWAVGLSIQNINSSSNSTFSGLIDRWNGMDWSTVTSPTPPSGEGYGFFGVTCVKSSDCWVVGAVPSNNNGGSDGPLTEHWDGTSWSVVPIPNVVGALGAILHSVSCVSTSDCWTVGETTDSGGTALSTLIEHWNGTAWSVVPTPPTGQSFDQLDSITCANAGCWAVGAAGPNQQNPNFLPIFPAAASDQALIEHWDGATWSIAPSFAAPSPQGSYLGGVTCVNRSDCWASGAITDGSGQASGTLMERWNGSSWSFVSSPNQPGTAGGILADVSCLDANRCWASGSYGTFGGGGGSGFQPKGIIESWDGLNWSIQPSPNVTAVSFLNSITCVRGDSCWAVGSAVTDASGNGPGLQSLFEQMVLPPETNQGMLATAKDGGVFTFGNAAFYGSMGGKPLNKPVVGIAATPDGGGYWEASSDGGVFTFGNAAFYGCMGGKPLNKPIVGLVATPDGGGYWEVSSDGGVFTFGDAAFYGSVPGQGIINPVPIVGVSRTPDGKGYWLVGADGAVYTYGDAVFIGSLVGVRLAAPVVGATS